MGGRLAQGGNHVALRAVLLCVLAGCSAEANICPDGLEPSPDQRCVPVFDGGRARPGAGDGGDAAPPEDGGADATATDAGPDADGMENRDARADGEVVDDSGAGPSDAGDGATDAGVDAGPDAAPAPYCEAEDVAAWDSFHSTADLTDDLLACAGRCEAQSCLVDCTMERAGLGGCTECVDAEATCLFETCWIACGRWESSPVCRACLCEARCTGRFEACAGRPLTTCEDAFPAEPAVGEQTPTEPRLLRYKPTNGHLVAEGFEGLEGETASLERTYDTHWSSRWTALSSFTHGGQTYLAQRRSECGPAPCLLRISPLRADGQLDAPLVEYAWTRGFDELVFFPHASDMYLFAMKTGSQAAEDPGPGGVRVWRLDFDDDSLALTPVLETRWAVAAGNTWSSVEALALEGETYLLRYATEPYGDADFVRVVVEGDSLELQPAGTAMVWDQGFDRLHTFRTDAGWHVLRYKSGTRGGNGVPTGTVEILPIQLQEGAPAVGEVAFTADWGEGITQVQAFRTGGSTFLLTNRPVTPSRLRLWRLAPAQDWSSTLGTQLLERDLGGTRLWNVMTVANDGRWPGP